MRTALIARSTLYTIPGGDTVHITETAAQLKKLGVHAAICLTDQPIDYAAYDIFHFFNLTRPADILFHLDRISVPVVLTPIFIDYSGYDRHHRQGMPGRLLRSFPADANEYIKTVSRAIKGTDVLQSRRYLWRGQRHSIREILEKTDLLLPNSLSEYKALSDKYGYEKDYRIVPNGINSDLFPAAGITSKDDKLVICAARIEGIKNQLNLIRALNHSTFKLLIIGSPAPNQHSYYRQCRKEAAANIVFTGPLSQQELALYYAKAKVHVLPSWFETCGLSSLEAAAMGCGIVITEKGYTRDYFGEEAFYCEPGEPGTIKEAVERAAIAGSTVRLQEKIRTDYTWEKAATITLEAYQKVIAR